MEKIGFIGLGIMGKPMAHHLANAGYPLFVLEKNSAAAELIQAGATGLATNKAVAENADVVITILPDSPQVEEVVLGKGRVIESIRGGSLFIDKSSIAPGSSKKIAELLRQKGVE